jgi:hypothetical protein
MTTSCEHAAAATRRAQLLRGWLAARTPCVVLVVDRTLRLARAETFAPRACAATSAARGLAPFLH